MGTKMTHSDISSIAIKLHGVDRYYEEVNSLKEDIEFFNLYIGRNHKSSFGFRLIPCRIDACLDFHDIYRAYGFNPSYIEDMYNVWFVMKRIIQDLADEDRPYGFDDDTIRKFAKYMREMLDLDITNYVYIHVGCSRQTADVVNKLREIIEAEPESDTDENES